MASYKLTGSVTANKQGDYNSNGSKTFSNSKIKIDFSSAIKKFKNTVGAEVPISISSAKLYIACTASGKSAKKYFNITYYNTTSKPTSIRSNGVAFDRTTSLNLNTNNTLAWLRSGSQIHSTDPQIKEDGRSSSSGGRYSENYVKISSAYIQIEYTITKSKFKVLPSNLYFRKDNLLSWTSYNSNYNHDISLRIGKQTFKYTTQSEISEINFKIPDTIASSEMADKKSLEGILTLTTYNSSGTELGREEKTISVVIEQNENYTMKVKEGSFEINGFTKWNNQDIIIANHSEMKFSIELLSDLGATVESCAFKFQDGEIIQANVDNNKFSCSKIFTNETEEKNLEVIISFTDSRGFTKEIEIVSSSNSNYIIYPYQKPILNDFIATRYSKNEEKGYILDEFEGHYIKITPLKEGEVLVSATSSINEQSNELEYQLQITNNNTSNTVSNWEKTSIYILNDNFISKDNLDPVEIKNNDLNLKFTLYVKDKLGNESVSKSFVIESAHYLLHFKKGKNSIGIGTAAEEYDEEEEPGKITMGWPVKMKEPLEVEYGGTGVCSLKGLVEKMFNSLLESLLPIGCLYPSAVNPKENSELPKIFQTFLKETYWGKIEQHSQYAIWKRIGILEYYQNLEPDLIKEISIKEDNYNQLLEGFLIENVFTTKEEKEQISESSYVLISYGNYNHILPVKLSQNNAGNWILYVGDVNLKNEPLYISFGAINLDSPVLSIVIKIKEEIKNEESVPLLIKIFYKEK